MSLQDLLKKKGKASGRKSCPDLIKVNKYEHPSIVLDLIAHICQKGKCLDLDPLFKELFEIQYVYETISEENSYEYDNADIHLLLWSCINDFKKELLEHFSSKLVIAVGGGYSSGKSSFLNSITEIGGILPTGIEPVSVVNTFLNCSSKVEQIEVRGENLKGDLVSLNKDVLSSIQHSSKSKVYIASVLNKLIIDIPNKELEGITFIDTPGYNNSDNINLETKRTDKDTALIGLEKAHVIFWCIDIDSNGGITNKDFEILKQIKEKPIVIFLTKMDKKPDVESDKIIKKVKSDCVRELDNQVIDVIGYSSFSKTWRSTASNDLLDMIALLKSKVDKDKNLCDRFIDKITSLITSEIVVSSQVLLKLDEERFQLCDAKQQSFDSYMESKDIQIKNLQFFEGILINTYDQLLRAVNEKDLHFKDACSGWEYALSRERRWSDKVGFFSDASRLYSAYASAFDKYKLLINSNVNYEYYENSQREDAYSIIEKYVNKYHETIKEEYDSKEAEYAELLDSIKKEAATRHYLEDYLCVLTQKFNETYHSVEKYLSNELMNGNSIDNEDLLDNIFLAIRLDDMNMFLSCFSEGVDMNTFNNEGFSPLTWTIKYGNNEMLKFFIRYNADLSKKDKNGYNALETAVVYHHQDICELLIKADPLLISESRDLVELSKINTFEDRLNRLINTTK